MDGMIYNLAVREKARKLLTRQENWILSFVNITNSLEKFSNHYRHQNKGIG